MPLRFGSANRMRPILDDEYGHDRRMDSHGFGNRGREPRQTAPLGRAVIGDCCLLPPRLCWFLPLVFSMVQERSGVKSAVTGS